MRHIFLVGCQGEGEGEREMARLVGGKENVQLVCVGIDIGGQAEQGHGEGLDRKHSRPGREVGRLADGEVTGKKDGNKQAGSTQWCSIQDNPVWVGKQVGREE